MHQKLTEMEVDIYYETIVSFATSLSTCVDLIKIFTAVFNCVID